jgi:hypothetical protein
MNQRKYKQKENLLKKKQKQEELERLKNFQKLEEEMNKAQGE